MSYEILVRLSDDEAGFIYTVRRGATLIEAALVHPTGPPRYAVPHNEYYDDLMAMD